MLHTPSSGSREAIPHSTWPPLSLLVCSGDPCACVGWTPAHPRFPRAPRGQAILWSLPFLLGNLMLRPEAATRAGPPQSGVWALGSQEGSPCQSPFLAWQGGSVQGPLVTLPCSFRLGGSQGKRSAPHVPWEP